ncbi:MAG: hypothetical protein ACI9WU_002742 [Myxococcota bacterium]
MQAHQADQRADEALRLAEREVKHGPESQCTRDREVGVAALTTVGARSQVHSRR